MIKEKKQAIEDQKSAEKKAQTAEDARKHLEKRLSEGSNAVGRYLTEIEELKETIDEQMKVVRAAHGEVHEAK